MLEIHRKYLKRCVLLAKRAGKKVKANPQVGAILVHENQIIGEGYHKKYGGPHAEVNAINAVSDQNKHLISKSTLYVSLEPCNHHGKTGPCSDFILEQKIPHVVIAQRDPNHNIENDGMGKLRAAGVRVDLIEQVEAANLIRPFTHGALQGMPYVILKFAQSKDFYMGQKGKQVWISNPYTQHLVHKWRSEVDGIMVGSQTVQVDNPKLTTRLHHGESPMRIILDRNNSIDQRYHVMSDGNESLIISESDDLKKVLKSLYNKGIYRIMVEGGATLFKSFIKENLWHEARIISSSKSLKSGIKAPAIKGKLVRTESLADDLIQIVHAA